LSATSSNTGLVPNNNLSLTLTGANGQIQATPVANESGTSTITVSYIGANSTTHSKSFMLTVNAVDDPPSITTAYEQTVEAGQTVQVVFMVDDVESGYDNVTLSASVSGVTPANLLQSSEITFDTQIGPRRVATITPTHDLLGSATVTIAAHTAGGGDSNVSFTYTVYPDTIDPDGNGTADDTPGAAVTFGYGMQGFGGGNGDDSLAYCKSFRAETLQGIMVRAGNTCETEWPAVSPGGPGVEREDAGQTFSGRDPISGYYSSGLKMIPLPAGPACRMCIWDLNLELKGKLSNAKISWQGNDYRGAFGINGFGIEHDGTPGSGAGCSTTEYKGGTTVRWNSGTPLEFRVYGYHNNSDV